MKKLLALLFCFMIAKNVFAVELWNGFTTDMSVNDVKHQIGKLFGKDRKIHEYKRRQDNISSYHIQNYFDVYPYPYNISKKLKYPAPDIMLNVLWRTYWDPEETAYENIEFYFYKQKLFAIIVEFELPGDRLIGNVQSTLGRNYEKEHISVQGSYYTYRTYEFDVYHWDLEEKIVYFRYLTNPRKTYQWGADNTEYGRDNTEFIISKKAIEEFNVEQQNQYLQQQKETEQRQVQQINNSVF